MDTTLDRPGPRPTAAEPTRLVDVLPAPPARILDAGCGSGVLAAALVARGYDVTAIDVDEAAVAAARDAGVAALEADLTEYNDEPYDVVLCSLSLHHMHPLEAAVARASALIAPNGLLVLDEFAWDRADRQAATWFYDTLDLLNAAGVLELEHRPNAIDPLTRWQHHHADHAPGAAMVEAVAARLTITELERTPYLARYLGGKLKDTAPGKRVRSQLGRIERDLITSGTLQPLGIRLVARHAHD